MLLKELICKFLFWECVVVMKKLIINNLYFGRHVVLLKEHHF